MSQSPYSGPPQSSGGGGGSVLVIVLVVLGVLGLLCVGVCGLGYFGLRWGVQEGQKVASQAAAEFQGAFEVGFLVVQAELAVANHPQVKERLGEPIQADASDAVDANGRKADAFDFGISGPNGKATVHVASQQQAGSWKIQTIQVKFDDGSVIDVDPGAGASFPVTPDTIPSSAIPEDFSPVPATPGTDE
jgi:hypothetical protein